MWTMNPDVLQGIAEIEIELCVGMSESRRWLGDHRLQRRAPFGAESCRACRA